MIINKKCKGYAMEKIYKIVAEELKIPVDKVENTIKLLDDGATIPFVARYRKEITGKFRRSTNRRYSTKG